MSKVSYLLVAYKSNETIAAAIESIKLQNGDFERETIVVDNNPGESCARLVLSNWSQTKVLINRENLGFTRAINQAIEQAQGDYLFFLNPDVELIPDCTGILLDEFEHNPQIGAVAPQLLYPGGSIQPSVRNFPRFTTLIYEHSGMASICKKSKRFGHWKNLYFDHDTKTEVNQPMASALMIRSDVQLQVGNWDEQFFVFFSDVDICRRIINAGYRILFVPNAKVYHLMGGSIHKEGTWLIYDSHRGFYRYLVKHELVRGRAILRPAAYTLLNLSAVMRDLLRRLVRPLF